MQYQVAREAVGSKSWETRCRGQDHKEKVIFEGFLLAESIERFFSFHFLVSQHHTSDVKSLGLVMLEEVKR